MSDPSWPAQSADDAARPPAGTQSPLHKRLCDSEDLPILRRLYNGMDYCRRIGLKRAAQPNSLSNLVYNMDRSAFLKRSA